MWDGADAVVSSRLAYPEVRAALAAVVLGITGWCRLSCDGRSGSGRGSLDEVRPVELTADVSRSAGALAAARSLRGGDAIHLASVLALGRDGTILVAWDHRLHAGVAREGLAVAPAALD